MAASCIVFTSGTLSGRTGFQITVVWVSFGKACFSRSTRLADSGRLIAEMPVTLVARMGQALDQSCLHRIAGGRHDDRYGRREFPRGQRFRRAHRNDDVHFVADQAFHDRIELGGAAACIDVVELDRSCRRHNPARSCARGTIGRWVLTGPGRTARRRRHAGPSLPVVPAPAMMRRRGQSLQLRSSREQRFACFPLWCERQTGSLPFPSWPCE